MNRATASRTVFVVAVGCLLCPTVASAVRYGTPTIQGRVYVAAEAQPISGIEMQLYMDDGDSVFTADDTMMGAQKTGLDGSYRFEELSATDSYFVVSLSEETDEWIFEDTVSGLQTPGAIYQVIDSFEVPQEVTANPLVNSVAGAVSGSTDQIIGGQRDTYIEVIDGVAEGQLRVNPYQLTSNLQLDMSAGVTGRAVVTWDGADNDAGMVPGAGLGAMDLTFGGHADGIVLKMAVDAAGAGQMATVSLYSNNAQDISTVDVEIPVVGDVEPTGFAYVRFADFVGGADPTSVDAIQLAIDPSMPSLDARFAELGVLGPVTVDFPASVGGTLLPEPGGFAGLLLGWGLVAGVSRRRRK